MKRIFSILLGLGIGIAAIAQDVTEPASEAPKQKFTKATFNATKIINMQSTEIVSKGALQFLISHHFSNFWDKNAEPGQNFGQLLGLNSGIARTYLSFDYSPTTYANVGLAAAGSSKYEGFVKFKLLRQQTGKKNIPVSLGWYSMAHVNTAKDPYALTTMDKFAFLHQLLIARKFSDKLSLELIPSLVHINRVPYGPNNTNNVFSIGLAGKYKMTSNKNLTFEYSRQLNGHKNQLDRNANIFDYSPDLLSVGLELNTGGHLFQFYIGATQDASNIDHLARNNNWLKDGQLAFGFTLNRSLSLKKD